METTTDAPSWSAARRGLISLPIPRRGVGQTLTAMAGCTSTSAATADEKDILGSLPDSVIRSILSFVPTLDAVRTSVLSRRWHYLWTSVGTLDLDDHFNGSFYRQSSGKRKRADNIFTEFVNKVLTFHHTPVLQRFRLYCWKPENYPVEDWIRAAVNRNAHELDLFLRHMNIRLPSRLFVSHSLVDLKLNLWGGQLRLPAVLDLPGLRSFYLRDVSFWDAHLTCKLLASCTALRSLAMVDCMYKDLECLEISCPLLESLTIFCTMGICQLKIFAPQLTFFEYRAPLTQLHAVKPLSSLVDVDVELYGDIDKFDGQAQGFFHQLSSAKNLTIYQQCVEAMWTIPCSPMHSSFPFHSLKHLKVSACDLNDKIICMVLRLLVANPCLRVLSLEVDDLRSHHGYTEEYLKIFKVYSEQISGVMEEVEISCPDLPDPLLQLVKMLLRKEASLKRLFLDSYNFFGIIRCPQHPYERKRLLQKVLSFPRRSSNLVVAFL